MQLNGVTALHIAAANGHTSTAKALLAARVTVSARRELRGLVSRVRDARDVSGL